MKIPAEDMQRLRNLFHVMKNERLTYWSHWRELADYILPRRYVWLLSEKERNMKSFRNSHILDGTATAAARVLASGMMNGITSPSRPWFKLRLTGFEDDLSSASRIWLDEVERRMRLVMAESNFYNALAVMYLDLVVFGTSAMVIYEDFDDVIHCFTPALGEFYIAQDSRHKVNTFARNFQYRVHQVVEEWGLENCTEQTKLKFREGGARLMDDVEIVHLIEPNDGRPGYPLAKHFKFRECYWEAKASAEGQVLAVKGYRELPGIFPRWELTGNDAYGSSPAMDAFGDIVQLQHETKKKAQGLDKQISPPMIADIQLQHRPTALLPNGVTFVHGTNNVGMKPAYQVQIPLAELSQDIRDVQTRIRETFHNDLFRMISQLETVRSATEIDARREEKLVLLGPVLERFENEALDPAIKRIFAIMERANLIPPPPPGIEGAELEIQYVSILSAAQSAVGTASTERFLQLVAAIAPVYPKAANIPSWDDLIRDYGRDIGVKAKHIMPPETTEALNSQYDQILAEREAASQGSVLAQGAKTLSETEVGGGGNVLQRLLGG